MPEIEDILSQMEYQDDSREKIILEELLMPEKLSKHLLHPSQYADKLRNGDVLIGYKFPTFLRKYWFSRKIAEITKSSATHASFYMDGQMVHARKARNAVVQEGLSDRKDEIFLVLRPSVCEEDRARLEERIKLYLRQPEEFRAYNYLGTLKYYLFKKFGLKLKDKQKKNRFFCSEFVAQCFHDIGIDLTRYYNTELVAAKDILESPRMTFMYVLDGVHNGRSSKKTKDATSYVIQQLRFIMRSLYS